MEGRKIETTYKLGELKILLPDASTSYFFIDEDLAKLFKVETNNEAIKLLRKTARDKLELDLYKRIRFDYESSSVIIRTTNAESILEIARIIHELANVYVSEEEINLVKNNLLSYKRPNKQKWETGDIFYFLLRDNTYAFGQVVWKSSTHPVCGLFNFHKTVVPTLEDIISNSFISVLSLTPQSLDNHSWKIIGNKDVKIQKEDVPQEFSGTSNIGSRDFSSGIFEKLANAFFGVTPWNVFAKEDFFDELLMPNVSRPENAKVLSTHDRKLYQEEKGFK